VKCQVFVGMNFMTRALCFHQSKIKTCLQNREEYIYTTLIQVGLSKIIPSTRLWLGPLYTDVTRNLRKIIIEHKTS
jgi:hypothetical protein